MSGMESTGGHTYGISRPPFVRAGGRASRSPITYVSSDDTRFLNPG